MLESALACHQVVIFIQKSSFTFTQGLSSLEVINAIMISLVVTIRVFFTWQSGWRGRERERLDLIHMSNYTIWI